MRVSKKNITIYALIFAATFLFLQLAFKYHFFYIEQYQLFPGNSAYFFDSLSYPGGLTEYLGRFFVQFFIVPFAGASVTALFLTLIYIMSDQLLGNMTGKKNLFAGPVSIFLLQLFMSLDAYFFFQGILAYLICLGALLFLQKKGRPRQKVFWALLVTPLIFWIAGSVSLLFAFCFALMNLHREENQKLSGLPVLILAILIAWLSVYFALTGNYRTSFLPDMYYHSSLKPGILVYLSWIILPLWIAVYPWHTKIENFKAGQNKIFLPAIQILLIAGLLYGCIREFVDLRFYRLKKLDYFARQEQWDSIIDYCENNTVDNYACLSYQNLALAQKGLLLNKLFYLNQLGMEGLEIQEKNIGGIAPLLSDIRFCIGDVASSQRHAFEGNVFTRGGSGRLMKRLVMTNLIYGAYPVAEKYIKFLENTLFYRKWATGKRCFLYNDSLCLSDPLISEKRKLLPEKSRQVVNNDILEMAHFLFSQNPKNRAAEQYMFAGYLLAKDVRGFEKMYSQYITEEQKQHLPDAFQQALLVFYETRPKKWEEEGISEANIRQFDQYRITLKNNQNHPHLEKMMRKYFGTTYWFFLHFR